MYFIATIMVFSLIFIAAHSLPQASVAELKPVRMSEDSLAFMFESTYLLRVTAWGAAANVDEDYWKCWQGFKKNFQP